MVSATVLALTVVAVVIVYLVHKFNTRVSASIPYAGSSTATRNPTLAERLRVPQEYAKDPAGFLCKTKNALGDVFCVDLLAVKIVYFLGPEGNREIFRAAENKLSFDEAMKWMLGPIVAHLFEYPGWQAPSNKIFRAAVLRQELLDGYYAMCTHVTESYFQEFTKNDTIPLFKSISRVIIANMVMLLTGESIYSRHREEMIAMMAQFEGDMQQPILRVIPWSLWRFTKPGKAAFATRARFNEIIDEEVRDIFAHPEKHTFRDDYLYFLVTQLGPEFASCYGGHIMTAVFAGHANAAMTIPWLFLHARRTPGALEKIREEATLPRDASKPYLEACFRETGRLYTNTSVMRMAQETVHVAGHVIPKGTLIAASPLATQRVDVTDNGTFENAGKWDPMRFLTPPSGKGAESNEPLSSAYTEWFRRAEFVQFGMGQHACPGEKMARMLIFDLALKTWMEKYDVEVVSGVQEGVKGVDGVGVEGAWTEENFGTPSVRGEDVMVRVRERRSAKA